MELTPSPWTLGSFSEEELLKLKQFKELSKDYIKESHFDLDLTRWLIARKWNAESASEMFINSMKWRIKTRADKIIEEFPKSPYYEILRKYMPDSVSDMQPNKPNLFRTNDGQFVYLEKLGKIDPNITSQIPMSELYRHHIWVNEMIMEQIYDCYKTTGKLTGAVVLEDIEGCSLEHRKALSIIEDWSKIDNDNYPETLRKVIIVNTPSVFNMLWAAMGLFWDENTKSKFNFFGSIDEALPLIKSYIEPNSLPKHYGGTVDWNLG